MADEAVQSIPGLTPIQYTMKHYAVYLQEITERARTLNQGKNTKGGDCTCFVFAELVNEILTLLGSDNATIAC